VGVAGLVAELSVVVLALLGMAVAAAGWLANRLGMPPSLGYLAVGIAISPTLAGQLGIPFEGITAGAHVAVLFLLFFIGLELNLKKLQEVISKTAGTTLFNIVVPAVLVATAAVLLAGWSMPQALALGIAVSISSTIFGERLSLMPGFTQESRKRMLGILLGEDVGAAALLAILVLLGGTAEDGWFAPVFETGRLLFFLVLITAGALLVVPRVMDAVARTRVTELLVLVGGALVLGFGALGAWAGSAELGALVAGVAAAEAGARFTIRNNLAPLRDLALAVFFVGSGMAVDASLIAQEVGLAVVVAGVFLASKLLVNVPASLAAGQNLLDSTRTSLGLGTLGEFTLILVAAAEANGVANPALRAVVVGAMVILLATAPLLIQAAPVLVRLAQRTPRRPRRAIQWLIQAQRNRRSTPTTERERRGAAFLLMANLILLVAWGLLATWAGRWVVRNFPTSNAILVPIVVFGVAVAVAAPLVLRAYRAYRDLVWLLVGMQRGEARDPGGRIRARLVDAWVVATVALLLIPVALVVPATLPVLIGGLVVAVAIVGLAWRQLSDFQLTLESTITRVLGHDPRGAAMLDAVMRKYPWGVRFAAGTVAPDSPVVGRTIAESRLHELTGALVAVIESRGVETVNPGPATRLRPGDTIVLMGEPEELAKAEALLVAHGEALRASVQSRLAEVVEVPVGAGSSLVGRTLGQCELRGSTGALVVGLWPHGADHPLPFRPDLVVQAQDELILLGAPLQVERARRLATGEAALS
jgi:CPA2 family monovalent cation:H+ antiporter-2